MELKVKQVLECDGAKSVNGCKNGVDKQGIEFDSH